MRERQLRAADVRSGCLQQGLDVDDGMIGQGLRYFRCYLLGNFLVQFPAHFAQHPRRRDQHDLLERAAMSELVELLGNLVGKTLLAETVPVRVLDSAAVDGGAVAVPAGAIRALFPRRWIFLFHLLHDLKIGIPGVTTVLEEQRLLAIGHHDPQTTLQLEVVHGTLLFLVSTRLRLVAGAIAAVGSGSQGKRAPRR
ncbi:hypothetical protein MESS4_830475 [Mesorhizobium sp. STM 4661]|nr:hypothetical protein MESS4_830475 [Mesorhizobium sp. STM 4661]